jgi:hypothetical protein
MTVTLTAAALAEILKPESNDPFLRLLEMSHADWNPTTFYFTNNPTPVTNAGGNNQTYTHLPFQIEPPNDVAGIVRVQLLIANVERTMIRQLRSIISSTPATVTLKLVLASAPNVLCRPAWTFRAQQMQYKAQAIVLTLLHNTTLAEVVPQHTMNPARNPGLYNDSDTAGIAPTPEPGG